MKKVILTLTTITVIGFSLAYQQAIELNSTRYSVMGRTVIKFQDPDNGSTCYILAGYGIYCLPKA